MADTTPKFNLKYGESNYLKNVELSAGTISVTTDTHSMYIDLPVKDNGTGTTEVKRFRVSDFEKYADLKALADDSKNWYVGSLALIENVTDVDGEENQPSQAPILAYYNGNSWININDTADLKKGIEDLQKEIEDILGTGIDGDPTSIAGLNKKIEDETDRAKAAESALSGRIDDINTNLSTNYSTTTEMNSAISTAISNSESKITGQINSTLATAKGYTDTEVGKEKTRAEAAESALSDRITILVGTESGDDTKSVRTIAADEVAKIVANAPASFDTLKEIADWIQNDTTGAASMANDIDALKAKTTLGKNSSNTEYSTVEEFVNAVKAELVEEISKVNNQFYWQPFTTTTTE